MHATRTNPATHDGWRFNRADPISSTTAVHAGLGGTAPAAAQRARAGTWHMHGHAGNTRAHTRTDAHKRTRTHTHTHTHTVATAEAEGVEVLAENACCICPADGHACVGPCAMLEGGREYARLHAGAAPTRVHNALPHVHACDQVRSLQHSPCGCTTNLATSPGLWGSREVTREVTPGVDLWNSWRGTGFALGI
jgi:hypothetical protein